MTGNYAQYYSSCWSILSNKNESRLNAKALDSAGTGLKETSLSLEAALRDSWADVIVIKIKLQTCVYARAKMGKVNRLFVAIHG